MRRSGLEGVGLPVKPRGIVRKIDGWGRVVLPKNVLAQFGLEPGDVVEVYPTERGFFISARGVEIRSDDLDRIDSVEM
jgi:bifunctional DNA-binding transcriptional regulator/antitoxin component of YhaV-PrlF toxin-antitoxin module